jgi:hypothetical protein
MTNDAGFSSKNWRARADEARTAAGGMSVGIAQEMLMAIADAFDRLAEKAAEDERTRGADPN